MNSTFNKVHSEIQRGMNLSKCRKCGCMKGTLDNLKTSLPLLKLKDAKELLKNVNDWMDLLEPLEYPCFGCKYCIPPEAMTILTTKYPVLASATLSGCEISISSNSWPPVEGEYTILDRSAPVAVSTLSSVKLEEKLARHKPAGLCIIGKTETENIGIDKIIKNVIANPSIQFLVLAGKDTEGHQSGKTLLALWENGVDKNMRVIGSKGRRPILKNVTRSDVDKFRGQIKIDNQMGSENTRSLLKIIKEHSQKVSSAKTVSVCGCADDSCMPQLQPVSISIKSEALSDCGCSDNGFEQDTQLSFMNAHMENVSRVKAIKQSKSSIKLDKAGYFVIIPSKNNGTILVEHYSYDNKLLRKIEGKSSRDIYFTIINNKWLTELSHAAYLGKELARAELSLKKGFKFVQDGA